MEDLCAQAELPVYPWHGDISQGVKSRARRNPRGVLLITPESLEALFVLRGLEIPTLFSGALAIIIDELHALLDNERGIHLRSLLTRLELAVGRRIRRVGLSATLADMETVKEYLRPGYPDAVDLLESAMDGGEVRVQLRGYITGAEGEGEASKKAVAKHLFDRLRGTPNLVFAGPRQDVEWYADALRQMSEDAKVPVDFLPHHASLSREHRLDVERRLKSSGTATAICTSTLELGIDIGAIDCVAQIGPLFSVSSLRQRLGRSGRRGQPAVLRMYSIERYTNAGSHPIDRLGLVRSVAMVELLGDRWCEPPAPRLHHPAQIPHTGCARRPRRRDSLMPSSGSWKPYVVGTRQPPWCRGRRKSWRKSRQQPIALAGVRLFPSSLSPGQAHDAPEGRELLTRPGPQRSRPFQLMDRAYESNETRQPALDLGFVPAVPPLSTRVDPWTHDREMYKRRN